MKAILISDKPKWCALMMNGDKTIEFRKNRALANAIQKLIDENGYADIYVYCTKDKERLVDLRDDNFYCGSSERLNGKVPFKFRCYKVEEIEIGTKENAEQKDYSTFYSSIDEMKLFKASCLDAYEILKYAGYCDDFFRAYKYKVYAIHISDLEIFDKPKELSEFESPNENENKCRKCPYYVVEDNESYSDKFCMFDCCRLTKAPQNFCYVEVE